MAGKTYTNDITEREVSIAIENLLIAPYGTAAPATGRIDVTTPPSGFIHLGSVVEESPNLSVTREKFTLQTGIPKILSFDAVISMAGNFTVQVYSNSNRIIRFGLGAAVPINTTTNATSISTATSRTQLLVASTTGFIVGDVVCTHITSLNVAELYADIACINAGILYLSGTGLSAPAGNGWMIGEVTSTKLAFGTSLSPRNYIIGVADFIDGVQVQHHFTKVSASGEFTENIQPGAVGMVNCSFDIFGITSAAWNNEMILGERVYIPKTA